MSTNARWSRTGRRKAWLACLLVACAGAVLVGLQGQAGAQEPAGTVLILGSTVSGGENSREAQAAIAAGYAVEIASDEQWRAKSTADFASYRAIVLGDPFCSSVSAAQAAADTTAVWGPAITGNVLIDGTDPVFHSSQGGSKLTDGAIRFATDEEGKTGAYISLSCYYDGAAPGTPVPVLDAFGAFTATGVPGCFDNAHIVAAHPALAGVTDADLSGWGCSVHEAFDSWPDDFLVLAIALTGDAYRAPDGTVGTPYILARGEALEVISDIRLTQEVSSRVIGEEHVVTATVVGEEGAPLVGAQVTFAVVSGPHAETGGTAETGADGKATFAYTGSATGTDTIEATFVDEQQRTQTSNRLDVTWLAEPPPSDITLTQETSSRVVGEEHVVTATVSEEGSPTEGATVTFAVVSGPHAELGGEATTDENGKATFAYTGAAVGTDTIQASFVDFLEETRTSNSLTVSWLSEEPPPPPPPPAPPAEPPPPDFSAPADLLLEITRTPATASVGDAVTFTIRATNRGPGTATDVRVIGTLSPALRLTGATLGQASCPVNGNAFTCLVGTLTNGGSAIVVVTGTVASAGDAAATVSVQANQTDPNQVNNSGSAAVPAPAPPTTPPGPFQPPEQLPPPRLGRNVNVTPVRGIVLVNGRRLRESEKIPVGAIINTRRGEIRLQSFNGTARFRDGLFRIVEPRVRGGFTELRLLGGNFLGGCGHPAVRRTSGAAGVQTHQKKVRRKLWGNGTGRFRTSGRFSAATVRGTIWLTADRCDGTLVQVRQGRVEVLDRVLRKRVVVRAGQSYLARAPAARR